MSDDVNTILIDHLRQRAAFGAAKYGKVLRPFDGRNTLKDALEETLDTAVYLQKELMEREAIADLLERCAFALEFVLFNHPDGPHPVFRQTAIAARETAARWRQDVPRVGVPASAEDDHFPWSETEYGTLCACGSPVNHCGIVAGSTDVGGES